MPICAVSATKAARVASKMARHFGASSAFLSGSYFQACWRPIATPNSSATAAATSEDVRKHASCSTTKVCTSSVSFAIAACPSPLGPHSTARRREGARGPYTVSRAARAEDCRNPAGEGGRRRPSSAYRRRSHLGRYPRGGCPARGRDSGAGLSPDRTGGNGRRMAGRAAAALRKPGMER